MHEMVKKLEVAPSLVAKYYKIHQDWEYIEDPTYSRSIGSHVCITCSKFAYTSKENCVSILCCLWHQKLICQGQHLTHSCELYQKKAFFGFNQKLNQTSKIA